MEMTDQVSRKRMMFSDDSFITALEAMDEHLKRSEFEMFESVESLIGFNNDDAKRLRSIRKDTESVRAAITNQTAILREEMMMKENKPLKKKKISDKKIDELLKCSEHEEFDRVKPLLIIAPSLPPIRPDPVARAPLTLVSPTPTDLVPPATTRLASLSEQGSIGLVLGPAAPLAPALDSTMEMMDQVNRKRMMFSDDSFITALEAMDEHLKRSEFEMFESVESLIGVNNDDAKRLRSIRKDTESVRAAITNQTAILREEMMMKENKPLEKKKISDKKIDELLKCSEHEEFDRVKPLLIIAPSLPPIRPDPVARGPLHAGVSHPHRFGASLNKQ